METRVSKVYDFADQVARPEESLGSHSRLRQNYYKLDVDILKAFSRARPPVDYFVRDDVLDELSQFSRKNEPLSKDRYEDLLELCAQGHVFVYRKDHFIYIDQLARDLPLLLLDRNLLETEVGIVFFKAITSRVQDFFQQPCMERYEQLRDDVQVLTEYIWIDRSRIKVLFGGLDTEHTLANHSFNVLVLGLTMVHKIMGTALQRGFLDDVAMGLLLHDVGLTKVPEFVINKTTQLKPQEQERVRQHPRLGLEMLENMGVRKGEILRCVIEHHERLDGSGYPRKLRGEDVGLFGRITGIADSLAAMISERPYAKARKLDDCLHDIARDRKHYDDRIAKALMTFVFTELA